MKFLVVHAEGQLLFKSILDISGPLPVTSHIAICRNFSESYVEYYEKVKYYYAKWIWHLD